MSFTLAPCFTFYGFQFLNVFPLLFWPSYLPVLPASTCVNRFAICSTFFLPHYTALPCDHHHFFFFFLPFRFLAGLNRLDFFANDFLTIVTDMSPHRFILEKANVFFFFFSWKELWLMAVLTLSKSLCRKRIQKGKLKS